jgi:uncharacterized protein
MKYGKVINEAGEALDYTYHSGAENNHYVLIIGHGLNENKDTHLITELSQKVSEEGMSVLRFSFSGSGNSQGQYGEYTISKGIEDLRAIISAVCEQGGRPVYLGRGTGATVGTLLSAEDSRIQFLISIAGLVETKKFCFNIQNTEFASEDVSLENKIDVLSENQEEDLKMIKSVYPQSQSIFVPWLLIHGLEDKLIPISDSASLASNCEDIRYLVELPNVDHSFTGEVISQVSELIIDWLGKRIQPS